jgi:membrane fusion protein, multidrug efflux system
MQTIEENPVKSVTFAPPPPKATIVDKVRLLLKNRLAVVLAAVSVLGVLVGYFVWTGYGIEDTDDAQITGHINTVSSRINGTISQVLVDDNQDVKAGQLLAVIDPRDYETAVQQAKYNLEVAKAEVETESRSIALSQAQAQANVLKAQGTLQASNNTLGESKANVQEAQAAVKAAEEAVAKETANYHNVQLDYQRYTHIDPEAVSSQQRDTATANFHVAEAQLNSAKANLNQAKARYAQTQKNVRTNSSKITEAKGTLADAKTQYVQVGVVQGQYQTAQAKVLLAQEQLRQAELNLSYTRITAPISGRIGGKTLEVGQRIQTGQTLLSVVPTDYWVVANYKEIQLQNMHPGQLVDIHVDSYPNHPFQGYVESFSPGSGSEFALLPPENATGNYTKIVQRIPVKIRFQSQSIKGYENLLTPGMSVIAKVHTK